MAFFSKSSSATLPLTMDCIQKNLKVDSRIAKISLPICSIINMNACAAFILITVLFVSESHGIIYSLPEKMLWIVLATIAAIGNAGVPMGCYFLSSAFLLSMGVPLGMLGIILPFYTLLDMLETSVNVWSDSCVSVLVNKEMKAKEFNTLKASN